MTARNVPIPVDVRLMNLTASLIVLGLALGCVATAAWWAARNPVFAIGQITVDGDTTHNSADSLRASVLPRLTGTFFTVDLEAVQAAFESAPWVRSALVQRRFPNRLHVTLQEHTPVARWGDDGLHMVDSLGQVFDTGGDDDADADLPSLSGPRGQAAELLAMYRRLNPLLAPLDTGIGQLTLQARGNWRAELDAGALIELGQGTPEQLAARLQQFAATVGQVAARHQRTVQAIESADLRHGGGYALRLQGVVTAHIDAAVQPPARAR